MLWPVTAPATAIVRHFGLNQQAASDVSRVFASPSATSNAITASSFVFFILGGVAAATAIQDLYEGAFGIKPRGVIFALMSFLIAIGVVIILGAIVGVVWRERHPPLAR